VPVYAAQYGFANFLWFSNIALLSTLAAVWLEDRLLASMMALAVVIPEIGWNIGFWGRLLLGVDVVGLVGYMFDESIPLFVRLLSLYHVPLPILLVWLVARLGYDPRALPFQTAVAWVVLPISYMISPREENINWVFGLQQNGASVLPEMLHLIALMIGLPLLIYCPAHYAFKRFFAGGRSLPRG
jgi:hypothetical protein